MSTSASSRLSVLAALLAASAVHGCPVCGQAIDQGSGAFLSMTIIMIALPLLCIGAVVVWVALRVRAQARADLAARVPAP